MLKLKLVSAIDFVVRERARPDDRSDGNSRELREFTLIIYESGF
jgi:hypothetical protein